MSDINGERQSLCLPQEQFEAIVSRPVELEFLGEELTLDVFAIYENHEIKTCYGDVVKIVNSLRDYAMLLEMVCDEWSLGEFQRATYEYYAGRLREIAGKYQAGIGYDYDAAIEKCRKKAARQSREDEPGGEAMAMAYLKSGRAADAKAKKGIGQAVDEPSLSNGADADSLWEDDLDWP